MVGSLSPKPEARVAMEPPGVDAPLRLGRGFLALYRVVLLPSIWFLHPWSAEDRYVAVISVILLRFLGSLAVYSVCLFAWAAATDFRRQKRAFLIFGVIMIGVLFAFAIVNWRTRPLTAYGTGIVSFFGFLLLRFLSRRFTSPSPDPKVSSVPPPGGQEPHLRNRRPRQD
jgi:hypothetical protein